MCCRYNVATEQENLEMREIIAEINRRRTPVSVGEIAPGASAPVLMNEGGAVRASAMRWGARSVSGMVINARSETAREKPMFRHSAIHRRLLLPMSGFYEWKHLPGGRRGAKYSCRSASGGILYMAGLCLNTIEGVRFVVLTRDADEQISPLHDRMPLFIGNDLRDQWLSGSDLAWEIALSSPPPILLLSSEEPEQLSLF